MTDTEVIQKVAEAVAAELVNGPFSVPFEVERSYADWEWPLDDTDQGGLRVDVVPVNNPATELETRGSVSYKVATDIVIRKKFAANEQEAGTGRIDIAEIDGLVRLVLEINAHFLKGRLDTYSKAVWDETAIRAAYIGKHLREHRQFTGVVRVTFDVSTSL